MISGIIWALIAAIILQDSSTFGRLADSSWWACLGGPLVGLAIYYLARPSYKGSVPVRILWAVLSVEFGAALYGVLLGIINSFHQRPDEVSHSWVGVPLSFLWGVTFLPTLWPLFALAYFNHWLVARYDVQA